MARRHLLNWIIAATAVNGALIALVTMVMQLPGQSDQVVTLSILAVLVLLTVSIVLPMAGHRVEERQRQAEALEQEHRRRTALLAVGNTHRLPQLAEVTNVQLGATPTRYTRDGNAPYIPRIPDDEQIRAALTNSGPPYPFVLVWGATKAGKSRILAEALRAILPADTPVVIPVNGQALAELVHSGLPGCQQTPSLVYLDDLTAADLEALTSPVLDAICGRAVLAATITAKRRSQILTSGGDITRTARTAVERAHNHELTFRPPTPQEHQQAKRLYPAEVFRGSIAETLVGGAELIARYRAGQDDDPAGCALVQAAVDWRRIGMNRPITQAELHRLFPVYLPLIRAGMPATTIAFRNGLHQWAARPIASQVALLTPTASPAGDEHKAGQSGWVVFDHAISADEGTLTDHPPRPIPDEMWPELLSLITPFDALAVAVAAYLRKQINHAITAARKAMACHEVDKASAAASLLGGLLADQGDVEGAQAAFQQAIDSGHADHAPAAAFFLGGLLADQGDVEGAQAAFQQAIDSGHADHAPAAAFFLGGLLADQGNVEGAQAVYQQAIDSGHADHAPAAAFFLGGLLADQGNVEGAQAAFQQAIDSGHADRAPAAAIYLGGLLDRHGDVEGARAAFQWAIDSGHADHAPAAATFLGGLLADQGNVEGARAAYQQAIDSGHIEYASAAGSFLGLLLVERGDVEGALTAFRQVIDSGHVDEAPAAAVNLGVLLAERGDVERALTAFRQVIDSGHVDQAPKAALGLAVLLAEQGDVEGARAAYQRAIDSDEADHLPTAALGLGVLLAEQGNAEGARAAYQLAIDSGHIDHAPAATFNLGVLLNQKGDVEGALIAYQRAIDSGHIQHAPAAAVNLGSLLAERGDVEGAQAAFRQAIDYGHSEAAAYVQQSLDDPPLRSPNA
ncbi:tetratricopeptide repeat protein [Sphaerisporangium sp. B11E5]